MSLSTPPKIALLGAGTIGLSFAALHLSADPHCTLSIFDPRPDLEAYVANHLPGYLPDATDLSTYTSRLSLAPTLEDAVRDADVVQEQGPEKAEVKRELWAQVEKVAPKRALLWSSTSGIPASLQCQDMRDRTRLVVVHPYNPPHIMPLLEVVPAPETDGEVIERTLQFWRKRGRMPVVVKKECTGFVANRLAFALLREACSLVTQGVVSVGDLDTIVTASMGPRWSVAGPFQSYHAGGGEAGLEGFMDKIGATVQGCWEAGEEDARTGGIVVGGEWQKEACRQAQEAYGLVDTAERDRRTRQVLEASRR